MPAEQAHAPAPSQLEAAVHALEALAAAATAGTPHSLAAALSQAQDAAAAIRNNQGPVVVALIHDKYDNPIGTAHVTHDRRGVVTNIRPAGRQAPFWVVAEIDQGAAMIVLGGAGDADNTFAVCHFDDDGLHVLSDCSATGVVMDFDGTCHAAGEWEPTETATQPHSAQQP